MASRKSFKMGIPALRVFFFFFFGVFRHSFLTIFPSPITVLPRLLLSVTTTLTTMGKELDELKRKKAMEHTEDIEVTDEIRQQRYELFMTEWFAHYTPMMRPDRMTKYAAIFCRILADKPAKEGWPITIEGLAQQLSPAHGDIDWMSSDELAGQIDEEDAEDIIRGLKRIHLLPPTVATKATTAAARQRALDKIEKEEKVREEARILAAEAAAKEKADAEAFLQIQQEVVKWEHGLRLTGTMKSGHGHLLCGISVSPTSGLYATVSRDKVCCPPWFCRHTTFVLITTFTSQFN